MVELAAGVAVVPAGVGLVVVVLSQAAMNKPLAMVNTVKARETLILDMDNSQSWDIQEPESRIKLG
ncbi:hypothetical protein DSM107003_07190 [Trichormus variabilis SAG 1403-4b]|uniref:Uncharacterized protein n=1 Tax=Trichormus variabilis SAG 1403-4b TaxID=447716 RepID=A0A3S1AT05_ANAVA|nr:hypothetical protein DSM107003_07190 [Trichormus variabilis SAG 1403-4b]